MRFGRGRGAKGLILVQYGSPKNDRLYISRFGALYTLWPMGDAEGVRDREAWTRDYDTPSVSSKLLPIGLVRGIRSGSYCAVH